MAIETEQLKSFWDLESMPACDETWSLGEVPTEGQRLCDQLGCWKD